MDAIGSITCGWVVKITGRIPIFIFGALLNAALITTLFLWRPDPTNPVIFFVIAGLWGLADSIWQTQINCKKGFHISISVIHQVFIKYSLITQLSTDSSLPVQKKPLSAITDFGRVWVSLSHSLTVTHCVPTPNFGYWLASLFPE